MTIIYPEEIMSKRIKELEAENERLRDALADIQGTKWDTMTQGCNVASKAQRIARAALKEIEGD